MKPRWQVQGFQWVNHQGGMEIPYYPARFRWRWQAHRFRRKLFRSGISRVEIERIR